MKISELIKITNAKLIGNLKEDFNVQISTDTRTIKDGDFYLPLKGASFDGEKFILQAFEKGAVGAFCTDLISIPDDCKKPLLQVPDTLTAYLQLANYQRRIQNYTVVAITGSSGKTTTKEIVASTLEGKFKVFKTPLNHNNEVGFCQTIFSTPSDTEVLVLEMGMRGLGEIELLSKYAEPDITIVSNVGTAHIGNLGSRENILKAKLEILDGMDDGALIINNDNDMLRTVKYNNLVTVGIENTSDYLHRLVEGRRNVKIVVLSTMKNSIFAVKALQEGAKDFIDFPCSNLYPGK